MLDGKISVFLVANHAGYVIFERFYDDIIDVEKAEWRNFLRVSSLERIRAGSLKEDEHSPAFVAMYKSKHVVYTLVGDLVIYVAGTGEYDELGLEEVLHVVETCLHGLCKKNPSEALVFENYGQFCLMVDEIINQGMLDQTEWDAVRHGIKMKKEQSEKA